MSIPLAKDNSKDSINTSIIAIKRNIERINMLLGLSNSEEIDTSEFVKKSDIVDEVTVGNMHSVTSNAVAEKIKGLIKHYDMSVGNKIVSINNYLYLGSILQGKIILGYAIKYWSSNSDCFNIINYLVNNDNQIYLIAKDGFSINSLQIRFYYLDI